MTRHGRCRAAGAGGALALSLTLSGTLLFSIPSSSAAALVAPAELRCACGGGRRFRGRPTVATALEPEEALERELDLDVEAARGAMFAPPRAAEGDAAFADTTWQVRLKLHEGGSCLFSAQLLEDFRARFSDKEEFGEWESLQNFVCFEKPKGLFEDTLYLSARLQLPEPTTAQKATLIDGVVQQLFVVGADDGAAASAISDEDELELRVVGEFEAVELAEAAADELASPTHLDVNI